MFFTLPISTLSQIKQKSLYVIMYGVYVIKIHQSGFISCRLLLKVNLLSLFRFGTDCMKDKYPL